MKKTLLLFVMVFVSTSAFAAGFAGKWKVHSNIAGNEGNQDCTFVKTGKVLTGSCKSDNAEVKVTGTVDDKKVIWKYDSEYNGDPLTLTFTGTLDDTGEIKGAVDVQPYAVTGEFTATPSKTEEAPQK